MLKSVISGLVAVSVLVLPVAAEARGRDGGHRGHRDRGSHINTGEAIAIGLGALILGAAVSGSNRRDDREVERDVYEREYDYHYRRNCREVIMSGYDRYGDYYEKRTIRCN